MQTRQRNRVAGLLLFIFWLTALIAASTSYAGFQAWIVFAQLSVAILIFLWIAALDGRHIMLLETCLVGLGTLIAVYFLFAHDWSTDPADLALLNRLGQMWMSLRWVEFHPAPMPNRVGGILATLLPFAVVRMQRSSEGAAQRTLQTIAGSFALVMIVVGLILSSSRAAWFAACIGLVVFVLHRKLPAAGSRQIPAGMPLQHIWPQAILVIFAISLIALALNANSAAAWLDRTLPGYPSGASRLRIILNSLELAKDFPLFGGGLAAFPGLYSLYILDIPHYSFQNAHNLFLDVAISQGLGGLAALGAILTLSFRSSLHSARRIGVERPVRDLGRATSAALLILAVHALVDDAYYGHSGGLLLFVLPAAAFLASKAADRGDPDAGAAVDHVKGPLSRRGGPLQAARRAFWRSGWKTRLAGSAVVLLLLFVAVGPIAAGVAAAGLANIGAVLMAQVQLAGFPTGRWDNGRDAAQLAAADTWLRGATAIDPQHAGANYRLGLIGMARRDFTAAEPLLLSAYHNRPQHYGIRKNLAYCQAWLGHYAQAAAHLAEIPEAAGELEAYQAWWRQQGRPDLAERAAVMLARLKAGPG